MKAEIIIETTDQDGDIQVISSPAVVTCVEDQTYKVTYIEDLSGENIKTKCEMLISAKQMSIKRKGEINANIVYERDLECHTLYNTAFGAIPIIFCTTGYDFEVKGSLCARDKSPDEEKFAIEAIIKYTLSFEGEKQEMEIRIQVR